jgi:hypothetical protein
MNWTTNPPIIIIIAELNWSRERERRVQNLKLTIWKRTKLEYSHVVFKRIKHEQLNKKGSVEKEGEDCYVVLAIYI